MDNRITIRIRDNIIEMIEKECEEKKITKSAFIKELIKNYFIQKYIK